ncbi:Outer membrane porin F precursor [Vibrio thalassae]|uniref:Outer membrane porin F n=1 Tax=Vibrio thalassae TaxID=1243014 RepID=A0A240EKF1_9VIBR|nr:OmpA family protein [Vibrio thalassae]SNX49066.1 Outer membrane porin F precursor [Vibrio thalassae]
MDINMIYGLVKKYYFSLCRDFSWSRECQIQMSTCAVNKMYSLMLFMGLFFGIKISHAAEVNIPMDLVNWQFVEGEFDCQLAQTLPNNRGKFYFHAEPNNQLSAVLHLPNNNIQQAQLFQLSAPWHAPVQHVMIDEAAKATRGYAIFDVDIEALLAAATRGAWIRVSSTQMANQPGDAFVLPSTRIESAYLSFNKCRSKLPEMNYSQARDLVLKFDFGQRVVTSEQRQTLQALASYIKADGHISKVLVDGHTDNVGSSLSNLQISRVRADDVASVLTELGTPAKLIEVRAHGARYPVSSNETEFGQANNRRVTVRVVRQPSTNIVSSTDLKTEVQ